jgi:CrcB protein
MTPAAFAAGVSAARGGFLLAGKGRPREMTGMGAYLWVGLGSALGGMARHWIGVAAGKYAGMAFPWGTLVINVLGSFIIGLFFTLTGPDGRFDATANAKLFVMVGLCGGFTTFSAFSLQTLGLMQDGEWLRAGANVVASVVLCLLAVWLGHLVAAALNAR